MARGTSLVLIALLVSAVTIPGHASPRFASPAGAAQIRSWAISDIEQDSEGFLWFGTADGLYRYDGYQFDLIGADEFRTRSVVAIDSAGAGTLWIATAGGGLYRYRAGERSIEYIAVAEINREELTDLLVDSAGRVWVGTRSNGVLVFDPTASSVDHVRYEPLTPVSLGSANVSSLAAGPDGSVVVAHPNAGISLVRADLSAVDRPLPPASFSANVRAALEVADVEASGRGTILMATVAGLVEFDPQADDWQVRIAVAVERVHRTARGLWVYAPGQGVMELDEDSFATLATIDTPSTVRALFEDESETLWAGTQTAGPLFAVPRWSVFQGPYPIGSGGACCAAAFATLPDTRLLVGTDRDGLHLLDTASGRSEQWYVPRAADGRPLPVRTLAAEDGLIAIGMGAAGVELVSVAQGRPDSLWRLSADVRSVAVSNGTAYIGTGDLGIIAVPAGTPVGAAVPIPVGAAVTAIAPGSDANVWFGTDEPAIYSLSSDGTIAEIDHPFREAPGASIVGLHATAAGTLVAADRSGRVAGISIESGTTEWLIGQDRLGPSPVRGIAVDGIGAAWIPTGDGLVRYRPETDETLLFDQADGFPADRLLDAAIIVLPDATLAVGTSDGIVTFAPLAIVENPFVPRVAVTDVRVPDDRVPDGAVPQWDRTGSGAGIVTLEPGSTELQISVSALDFSAPGGSRYAFRLSSDAEWSAYASSRVATFRGLVPGNYDLAIRATNSAGITNSTGTTLRVEIRPFFWQSSVFVVIAAIAVVGIAWIIVGIGVARADEQRRALQAAVRRRTSDLESSKHALEQEIGTRHEAERALHEIQADLEQRVAHRTSALRQANEQLAHEVQDRREAQDRTTNALEQNKALLQEIHHRVKNNMQVISSLLTLQSNLIVDQDARLAFQTSRQRIGAMALIHDRLYHSDNFAEVEMGGYFSSLAASLRGLHGRSVSVQTHVRSTPLVLSTATPCGLIANELVTNAMKHAFVGPLDGEAKIRIEFVQEGEHHVLRVADNGQGYETDRSASPLPHEDSSLGMRIVEVLVSQINGTMTVKVGGESYFRTGTEFSIAF